MTLLQDKDNRRYLCVCGTLVAVLLAFCAGVCWQATRLSQHALLAQEQEVATVLLAEDVPQTVVVRALTKHTAPSAEALSLLEKIGHEDQSVLLGSANGQAFLMFGGSVMGLAVLMGAAIILAALWYLRRMEKRYLVMADVIDLYAKGAFDKILPNVQTGVLAQLWGEVQELALALAAKSEKEEQQKEFLKQMISDISHQLKTPLTALSMYNEILLREPHKQEVVREFAAKSAREVTRLETLIQSLLKIARLDSGSVAFLKRTVPLRAMAEQSIAPFLTRAEREGKVLMIEGDEMLSLCCDPVWMREALGNLVKNALDHTVAGCQIKICWIKSTLALSVRVEDDGSGIAPDELPHIFKRFYRSPKAKQGTGVGLGLAIAKGIVEGQGGSLAVESTVGEGTVFTASFPAGESGCCGG